MRSGNRGRGTAGPRARPTWATGLSTQSHDCTITNRQPEGSAHPGIFGEPALLFGVMLSAVAFYGWRRGAALLESTDLEARVGEIARPMKPIIIGAGLSLLAVAAAGMSNQLFTAPPQEPISGWVAGLQPVAGTDVHLGTLRTDRRRGPGNAERHRLQRAGTFGCLLDPRCRGLGLPARRRVQLLQPHRSGRQHHVTGAAERSPLAAVAGHRTVRRQP